MSSYYVGRLMRLAHKFEAQIVRNKFAGEDPFKDPDADRDFVEKDNFEDDAEEAGLERSDEGPDEFSWEDLDVDHPEKAEYVDSTAAENSWEGDSDRDITQMKSQQQKLDNLRKLYPHASESKLREKLYYGDHD